MMLRTISCACLSGLCLFISYLSFAQGYIELPDTTEVPVFERESMQLDMDVPPVRDRDPDPLGGPRLNVKEFRLQGVVEYPELGITRESIIKRVENIRFDLMKENELTEYGYTEEEISEIADLMADIEKDTEETHVGPLDVQRLVFLIRDQRRKRGVTLGMIENVADVITQFYREKGFILAKAYIPQQKVRDGVVTLTLLLGELGEVQVVDAERVSENLIQRAFKSQLYEPVTATNLEESLYLVNDVPGLNARGYLSPGKQVGDTLLRVQAQKEKWVSGNVRIDNHGSPDTSQNRLFVDAYLHNPAGLGDELYLALLNSFAPENNTYGALRYSSFWGLPKFRSSIGYSLNEFVSQDLIGQGENRINLFTGTSEVTDISFGYVLKRRRVKNLSLNLEYSEVEADINQSISEMNNTKLSFNFDVLSEAKRRLYLGEISMSAAKVTQDENLEFGLESDQRYLNFDVSMLMFVNFPFTKKETRLLIKGVGQYAGKSLSNLNQLNLAGPDRTRGFAPNAFQADDALYLGVDWIFSLPVMETKLFSNPLHQVFQPYLFIDGAYGETTIADEDAQKAELADIGVGIKVNMGKFNANLFGSSVLLDKVGEGEFKPERVNFYAELSYSF